MVALVDGVPRTLSLLELIHHYVDHQREVVTRRTQYELRRAEARAHILEGLLIALDNLDAVIKLIRASADPDAAREGLIEKFELSREQAQAILDMRLQRLTALESDKVSAEHAELVERIRRAAGDPRRRVEGARPDQGGAGRDRRALRRRAAHRDHPLRGRHRHRGHDRRPADGDLDDRTPATPSGCRSPPTASSTAAASG